MEIIQHEQQKHNVPLTSDYRPNQTMVSEFRIVFFTCKLQRTELYEKELKGSIVDDDAGFLMLYVTIQNATNEVLIMYKDDFMVAFDNEGPFEAKDNFEVRNQLSDEYVLKPQEEISGCLVFIVSSSAKKIMLSCTGYLDNESEGETYRLKYEIG